MHMRMQREHTSLSTPGITTKQRIGRLCIVLKPNFNSAPIGMHGIGKGKQTLHTTYDR